MADKCIGNLTLNIDGVKKSVEEVNKMLESLGVGKKINISSRVTAAVRESLKDVENLIKQSEQRIAETADKAAKAIEKIGKTKADGEANNKSIQSALVLYEKLFNARNRLYELEQKGQQNSTAYAKAAADVVKYETALGKLSEKTKQAAQATKEYDNIINKAVNVRNAAKTSEEAKEVEKATQAYIKLLEAKSKVKQLEIEGKQDTEEYLKATQAAGKAYDAFIQYSKGAREAAKASKEAAQARKDLNAIEEKVSEDTSKVDYLAKIKQQYFEITDAIKNYNAAKKAGDETGMAAAQARIDAAMQEVASISQVVDKTMEEGSAKQQVLNYIQQCTTAEHQHSAEIGQSVSKTSELESQVNGLLTRYLSLMAVIRTITSLMSNMIEYVSEYSDKMNEIQMITMKSDAEVESLAKTYRNLAKDMRVSSLDMADAAIYFTRQGLGAADIEKRLKNVTMYAKAANVEFKDASEIITAVVNSMGLVEQEAEDGREAAQRVADVFLNIGDHAATSGQEIGEAMQKAAASAGAFGVSMEWLAAYIATVSETTRQEARTIGTAFNTIIARLHQIKQTGYNQEDETKVNDIAKALSKIDVALMDQEGNWRDMETILEEIAAKWDGLDGKTKSYIATTMAGVKQQNVFLALMNDMSKGVEENSRAYELHALAMESNGVAAEKYGVYLDSVTASQERLTVAQEKFYSILSQDVIKGWNNAMADFVGMIADGAEAWGNWTVIVPVVIGIITGLVIAIKKVNTELTMTASIMKIINDHPVMLAISAAILVAGALVTAINAVATAGESADEKLSRINKTISDSNAKIAEYKTKLGDFDSMMQDVGKDSKMTSEEIEKYNGLLNEISMVSPKAAEAVEALKNNLIDQKDAYELINEEIQRYIENEQIVQAMALAEKAGVKHTKTDSENLAISMLNNGDVIYQYLGEISDDIYDEISEYFDRGFSWGSIEKILSHKYLEGKGPSEYLRQNAESMIDEYINVIGMTMNNIDKSMVRSTLASMLFGDDGILDLDEYENMGNVFQDFINKAIAFKFDPGELIGSKERIKAIGESIFGDFFDVMFGDQLEDIMQSGEADIIADRISQAVSELMEAGFSDVEIGNVLRNIDLSEWANAIGAMRQYLLEEISKNAGNVDLGFTDIDMATGEETYDLGMWEDLDVSVLKLINDIVLAGTELITIQRIMEESSSPEEFANKLNELAESAGIVAENNEEAAMSFSDLVKAANAGIKDIQALDAAIKDIEENKNGFNVADMLSLAEAHPELLTVIGDTKALLETLRELRKQASDNQGQSIRDMILSTSGSKYGDYETLSDYRATLSGGDLVAFDKEIDDMVSKWQQANINAKQVAKETKEEVKEAEKSFQSAVKEVETLDKAIEKLQSGGKVDFSDIVNLSTAHPEIVAFANDADKLIEILKKLKAEAQNQTKDVIKNIMLDSAEYYKNSEYYHPQYENMRDYITSRDASGKIREDAEAAAESIDKAAQDIIDAADATDAAAETWLEAQAKIAEQNKEVEYGKATGFAEQINQLHRVLDTGYDADVMDMLSVWENYDSKMKESIASTYPNLIIALNNVRKALRGDEDSTMSLERATQNLDNELNKIQRNNTAKYFKESYEAIQKLENGTISVTDAYDTFDKEVNKVTKAYEDILDVQQKLEYNAKDVNKDNQQAIDAADVTNLANLLGMTTDQILADFPAAVEMFDELTGSAGQLQAALDALNQAAFVRITGIADADFSNITNGLMVVEDEASEAVKALEATGQWTTDVMELPVEQPVWKWNGLFGGGFKYEKASGRVTVLKPTGNNPFGRSSTVKGKQDTKSKSGGGGGGGGGKNNEENKNDNFRDRNVTTEVEKMLDMMSQVQAIQQYQQNWYQSQQKYYQQTGQLQGVIGYMQKEKEALEAQNKTLDENVRKIEQHMNAKKAELASMSTEDEKYQEVADDLDKLQKAHQDYTKQVIDNKTAIESLTQSMDEQRKKIRQMEIDLRNTILKAIEDREAKRKNMLSAEIEMENTILDVIKRRYEIERDQILEITNMKIEALQKERDLLDEQLRIRREQAEEEDKAVKLRELEVKYQRIIADPTRSKEAQSLRKEIDDLREEMAWDLAEKEVKAQQDSIDQQIESLEDYSEYIQEYYEDLFEHPKKLIEEMRQIIMGTQEEILEWLKTNDEAYREATENTQKQMVEGWEDTYNEMKGILKLYWDEVEYIISQGDEYIIDFLKKNSADYAAAGKLQAEAYVDEWQKQLDDLKKAHEEVAVSLAASYAKIQQAAASAGADSGGGGGGSGGPPSGGSTATEVPVKHGYSLTIDGKAYQNSGYKTKADAANAASAIISSYFNGAPLPSDVIRDKQKKAGETLKVYKRGGIADYTGPAWLDGSPEDPERVLSPYQTSLFETMVEALERMSTIPVMSMPNIGNVQTAAANPVSVGDIIVNVDNLDTDDDYEELARKVSEVLMEEIGRTAVVGGLHIRSI